jgi:Tat protein translocase TatB subunit
MLGIGFQELVLILVVAVVVVGPKKLPDLAKSLGKGLQEFRKATEGIKSSLNENDAFKDLKDIKDSMKDTMSSLKPAGLLDIDPKPTPAPTPELKKFEAPAPVTEAAVQEPLLEPKQPQENLEGRIMLMDGIVSEHHQPGAEILPSPAGQPDEPPVAATPAAATLTTSAPEPEPLTKPAEASKKTDA